MLILDTSLCVSSAAIWSNKLHKEEPSIQQKSSQTPNTHLSPKAINGPNWFVLVKKTLHCISHYFHIHYSYVKGDLCEMTSSDLNTKCYLCTVSPLCTRVFSPFDQPAQDNLYKAIFHPLFIFYHLTFENVTFSLEKKEPVQSEAVLVHMNTMNTITFPSEPDFFFTCFSLYSIWTKERRTHHTVVHRGLNALSYK